MKQPVLTALLLTLLCSVGHVAWCSQAVESVKNFFAKWSPAKKVAVSQWNVEQHRFNPTWSTKEHAKFYRYFGKYIHVPHLVKLIGQYTYQSLHLEDEGTLKGGIEECVYRRPLAYCNKTGVAISAAGETVHLWDVERKTHIDSICLDKNRWITSLLPLRNGWLAMTSNDERHSIQIFDLANHAIRVRRLFGHSTRVTDLAETPCGFLLSLSCKGMVRMWNVLTGECIKVFRGGLIEDQYGLVILSHDAIAAHSDRHIIKWDMNTGERFVFDCKRGMVGNAVVLSDGTLALSGDCQSIWFWDLQRGACTTKLDIKYVLYSLLYLPVQDQLIVGCRYGIVLVIDAVAKKVMQRIVIPSSFGVWAPKIRVMNIVPCSDRHYVIESWYDRLHVLSATVIDAAKNK